jgi:hypothetical protein
MSRQLRISYFPLFRESQPRAFNVATCRTNIRRCAGIQRWRRRFRPRRRGIEFG